MKTTKLFLAAITVVLGLNSHAQVVVGSQQYQTQKANGTLNQANVLTNPAPVVNGNLNDPKDPPSTPQYKSSCECYVQPDATYTVANFGGATDDGSQGPIAIPFNFCLYGTTYNSFYLNINGNITFDQAYGTFSSVPFPSNQYVMVAPFWGDVDLGGTGTIYYKITPTAVYINWEQVGYYSSQVDKVNTFQLIITDGTDPAVPNGDNIAFCYGDMQWTTGSASGGVNGFGGTPATVGVNKGDGIDYIQLGRFDQAGNLYDGPIGNPDGVDWLDNQSLYFNVCSATNIPPIFGDFGIGGGTGVNGGNNCVGGDTIRICGIGDGDTLILNPSFLAPEAGETVTVTANFNGMTGASVISSTPGNPGSAGIMIIGDASNAGYHVIDFTGTDDGTPSQSTTVSITIFVDVLGNPNFTPVITGDTLGCTDVTLALDSAFTYDSYDWSHAPSDSTLFVNTTGSYWVTVVKNGCIKSALQNVTIVGEPQPVLAGNSFVCPGDSTFISIDLGASTGLPYDSLDWGNGLDTTSTTYWLPGSHTVTVVDTNGCTGTASLTVTTSTPLDLFNNTINLCSTLTSGFPPGGNVGENGGTWSFNGPAGATVTFTPATDISPSITVSEYGNYEFIYQDPCGDVDTAFINFGIAPVIELTDTFFCAESFPAFTLDPDSINGSNAFNYSWNTSATTETISVTDTGMYVVTVSNACGSATDSSHVTAVTINFPGDTSVCGLAYVIQDGLVTSPSGGTWSYVSPNPLEDSLNFDFTNSISNDDPWIYANNYGTYTITYEDSLCGITKDLDVEFKVLAWTQLFDDTLCLGTSTNLLAYGPQNTSWMWNTGATSDNITVTSSGQYSVTVSNSCNSYSDTANIVFIPCSCNVPNVITPNGDGMNETLVIDCVQYYEQPVMQIYNRWGNMVYQNDKYDNSWDGKDDNGVELSDGTYYFVFTVLDNPDIIEKGTVNVFR